MNNDQDQISKHIQEPYGGYIFIHVFSLPGCGIVDYVNNTLKSPGYPFNYPNYMDCVYWVPIPTGMAMRIDFVTFNVESHSLCK